MATGNASSRQGPRKVGATPVFLRVRDTIVRGDFSELVCGEFPMTYYGPLPLQLPPGGTANNTRDRVQCFLRGPVVTEDGGFSDILYLPLYTSESLADPRALEDFSRLRLSSRPEEKAVLAKIPLLVIATRGCACIDEGRQSQSVHVLPIWSDGTSVLLDLNWCEGDPCEDGINPEWHLRASTGLPLEHGLAKFVDRSRVFPGWKNCEYHLYIIPSILGEEILHDHGEQWSSPLWRREWTFATCDELRAAVSRLSDQMEHLTIYT